MKILVDTSVLIDVLRKRDKQRELLASLVAAHHTPVTTVLNIAELYAGMRPSERTITRRSFGWLTVPWYHRARCAEGKRAQAHIWAKRGRTLGLTDALIAAVAIEEECALLTEKNFRCQSCTYTLRPEWRTNTVKLGLQNVRREIQKGPRR